MDKTGKTTLWNIGAQRVIRLQTLALELVGKRSLSALVRHIADVGQVVDGRLVVEKPVKGSVQDGD